MTERFSSSSLRDFLLEEELSRGTHGSIWRVKFKYDGRRYVLKELKLNGKLALRNALKETELLRQLDHRNCIQCFGHFIDDGNKLFYIVLEYCDGGDLAQLVSAQKEQSTYFDESFIWSLFQQICLGVQHLHQMGIVHRDLKTSNIFLVNNQTPKIGDLGVSHQVSENTLMLQTFSGTPLYLSPELVRGQLYNEKTDIWSLGIVLFELCALSPPFVGTTLLNLAQAIDSAEVPPLPSQYSSKLDRYVRWLLQRDQSRRPSIAQMVEKISKHLSAPNAATNPCPIRLPPMSDTSPAFQVSAASKPSVALPTYSASRGEGVSVDVQRLATLEKRDRLTLRNLLQTRTLSAAHSNRPLGQQSEQRGTGELNEQIQSLQDRLQLLEGAISRGGRIERAEAER
jgi:serine/threonine protein kinase